VEHHPLQGSESASGLLHFYPNELTPQADESVGYTYLLMTLLTCLYLKHSPALPLEEGAYLAGESGLWLHDKSPRSWNDGRFRYLMGNLSSPARGLWHYTQKARTAGEGATPTVLFFARAAKVRA